jgi:hypothetical protein
LVGSAYNDWGNDGPDASFNRDWRNEDVWVLENVELLAGEWKIRADNDWALNYGDTGANGTLEVNGDNVVSTAGIHKVTVDFSTDPPTYTVVKY